MNVLVEIDGVEVPATSISMDAESYHEGRIWMGYLELKRHDLGVLVTDLEEFSDMFTMEKGPVKHLRYTHDGKVILDCPYAAIGLDTIEMTKGEGPTIVHLRIIELRKVDEEIAWLYKRIQDLERREKNKEGLIV